MMYILICMSDIVVLMSGMLCLCMQTADAGVPTQFERLITINKVSDALGNLNFLSGYELDMHYITGL